MWSSSDMCAYVAFVCVHFVAVCFLFVYSSVCCVYIYESECLCGKKQKKPKTAHTRTLSIFTLVSGHEVSLAIKSHYQPTKWT